MMTRKDYIRVSDILNKYSEILSPEDFAGIVEDFAEFFSEDNPRFDINRFIDACWKLEEMGVK